MIRFISKIYNKYLNMRIRYKFFIAYMLLLIIPLFFVGLAYYRYFLQNIEQQTSRLALQAIRQSDMYIDYLLNEVENYGEVFSLNTDIHQMLQKRHSRYDEVSDYKKLLSQIYSLKSREQIFDVNLYVSDEKLYARDNLDIFPLSDLEDNPYYNKLVNMQGKTSFWTESYVYTMGNETPSVLSYMTLIRDFSDIREVVGCLSIDILESQLGEILGQIEFGGNNQVFILNSNLKMVASASKDERSAKLINEVLQQITPEEESLPDGYRILQVGGDPHFVVFSKMDRLDWTIISAVPTKEVFYETNKIAQNAFMLLIVAAIFGALIAALLSVTTTRRIVKLTERIRKSYDFEGAPEETQKEKSITGDEVTVLSQNYESMIKRIRQLIKENYEVEIARKEEEFKALQAQINPHFLYNTFDTINWMAIRIKADNISETLGMVADFYRISLSDGRDIITFKEEFKHAELYMELQKKRQDFQSEIKLPKELEMYTIPKLVIQPLVENAIIHGIREKPEQTGMISVDALRRGDKIVIYICDNAAAIDLEYVKSILEGEGRPGTYGLKNVDERIKLHFGAEYGLRYGVSKGLEDADWTVAEIHIPAGDSSPYPSIPENELRSQ
jgi:two-component system sensor histidine kinase YesM